MAAAAAQSFPRGQYLAARLMDKTAPLWVRAGQVETAALRDELASVAIDRPIYVTALARAGTTILTEILSRHPAVTSHRYSDFPAVLTPYWWNWLRARMPLPESQPTERAHQDRLRVTPDSPEAVEEVLWTRFFDGLHDSTRNNALGAATINRDFERFYKDHIRKLLLVRGAQRYLAKGNYNLTRLEYLLRLVPDARFVVMARRPENHIASLLKQDRLFRERHRDDPRQLRYMQLLGHFEFGLDKRCINVGDSEAVAEIERLWESGETAKGWARYWAMLYENLLQRRRASPALQEATLLVRYEDLCARPGETWDRIVEHCGLSREGFESVRAHYVEQLSEPSYYAPDLSAEDLDTIERETRHVAGELGYESGHQEPAAPSSSATPNAAGSDSGGAHDDGESAAGAPAVNTESAYEERMRHERDYFRARRNVHELPPIFHYWSNKYLRPRLEQLGYSSPDDFFGARLEALVGDRSYVRALSLGSGNAELEIPLAQRLLSKGFTNFTIVCTDINDDMLARGRASTSRAGVEAHIGFKHLDFNYWHPEGRYDAILANQCLHHVVELEHLIASIDRALTADGYLLVSDMIGRNGHMRWPKALRLVEELWSELSDSYKYNHQTGELERAFINRDCSVGCFEGIRAQDILPLLLQRFDYDLFLGFANIVDPFIDRAFGHNFDADNDTDRAFIDRVHALDESCLNSGELGPTHMIAAFTRSANARRRHLPPMTPEHALGGVERSRQ